MDAIDTFLDAMFAPYPTTPRLLEAKGELHAMMEDAYADAISRGKTHNEAVGQVITDFGNLEELAPALGILPDIRSARTGSAAAAPQAAPGVGGAPGNGAAPAAEPGYPAVTLPEAQALAEARRTTGRLLGRGVALFILSPIPLLIASGLSGDGTRPSGLGAQWTVLIGLVLTLGTVTAGVLTLMRRHRSFVGLEHLIDGRFTQNPVASAWAARLRVDNEGPRSRALMAAVGLWILSPIPTVAALTLSGQYNLYPALGVALTLALVATGLRILLPTSWASSTHETLIEEGRPAAGPGQWVRWDTGNPVVSAIAAIYWPTTLVVFLVWGVVFDGWGICWIVWPVAGVLFGGFSAFIPALSGRRVGR